MVPGERQSSDWHQRMANLVGLEEEIPPSHSPLNKESSASQAARSNDQPPPSDPSSVRTQQSLSSNPFAKVGVVGGATLFVVLIAGVFLSQLMSGTNKQPRNIPQVSRQETNESKKTEQLKPEEEIEILKTKLALAEQAKAVKAAQLQLKTVRPNQNPTRTQSTSRPQPATRVVVQRVPTPTQTVYVPRVVERIVRVPQPVAQVQPTSTQSPQTLPQVTPSPSFELSTPGLNPSELAQIPFSLSVPTPSPTPNLPRVAPSPPNPNSEPISSAKESAEITTVPRRTNTIPNPQPSSLASNQTNQYAGKTLAIGTSARAVLADAITGESSKSGSDNSNSNKNDTAFVVRLKEPLKSVDGAIALPKDTELVAQLQRISETGWVQLNVISMIPQKSNGKLTEIKLPSGAIKIRAPQGRPLLARKYPDKSGKIAGNDLGLFVAGGLGKIGDVLNRPESRLRDCGDSIEGEGRRYLCTVTEQQRNIPAAVLEGGMNAVVPQISQRSQQASNELITKSNIWFLPEGTEVEVVVNRITKV
ncbi:hypothetical protein BZZ01_12840 [Nostocales cyanobacterium HT-58-2]|nr:hypothetical protein BZZ01_12840 [Nostocales cyanobacterium HT-58-2]